MRTVWYRKVGLLALGAAIVSCADAQTSPRNSSLEEFYRSLVANGHAAPMEVQMKVMKRIPGTGSEEIKKALPAILAALTYDDLRFVRNFSASGWSCTFARLYRPNRRSTHDLAPIRDARRSGGHFWQPHSTAARGHTCLVAIPIDLCINNAMRV